MYLSPTLSINAMYPDYTKQCLVENKTAVLSSMYASIFNTDFNLGFGSPHTDTCGRCEMEQNPEDLSAHKQKADAAFQQQRQDRQDAQMGNSAFITFDMEKTLPLPKLSVSEAFYLRQLWLYNVGIHLVTKSREAPFFHI